MTGHSHNGKSHLLGMVGIGAGLLALLVLTGRSFGDALPVALALACPLMMVAMMVGGHRRQHTGHHGPPVEHRTHPAEPSATESTKI
ncbi:hypothetical protein [Brachybacterium sp. UNK5269]|uniref:hypothetical protein n=1 Tax=Brachybacterium sp. UNK5269 TaxID=3408576 RepID=UPI003BAF2067